MNIIRSETLGKDCCTASTDNGKDSIKDRCTVTMESTSASDRGRRLARERLQRCHLADLKLFFPLAFSHSRSPAYVRTALLVHVTMQIFVVVLVVVVFVVSLTGFSQPTIRVYVSVLFLFTCILYCIAFLLLREAFLRMRIPSNIIHGVRYPLLVWVLNSSQYLVCILLYCAFVTI